MEAAERSFHDSAYVPIWSSLFWWRSSAASPGWNQNFFSLTNHFQEHVMLQECLLRSFIICYLPVPPTSLFVFIIQMFWSSSDFQKIPYSLKSHLIILHSSLKYFNLAPAYQLKGCHLAEIYPECARLTNKPPAVTLHHAGACGSMTLYQNLCMFTSSRI